MSEIHLPRFAKVPGLLVTATDTGVGKTVVTCAILQALREQGATRTAGYKPYASGCRLENDELVSDDTLALQRFSDLSLSIGQISPARYEPPLAPAVAAEQSGGDDHSWQRISAGRMKLADACDWLVVEGVGGLLVPLNAERTVLDLAVMLQYPVLVVARSTLGTLNHTAMTVRLLREARCPLAGVVINGLDSAAAADDPSIETNRRWIEKLTGLPVLAVLPRVSPQKTDLCEGVLPEAIMQPMREVKWREVLAPPARLAM